MPYSITFDADRRIIRLDLKGFWSPEIFDGFAREFQAVMRDVMRVYPRFDTYADASRFHVQRAEIAEQFRAVRLMELEHCPSARAALFFRSALARMQAQRVAGDDTTRVFDNEVEALAWLATPPD